MENNPQMLDVQTQEPKPDPVPTFISQQTHLVWSKIQADFDELVYTKKDIHLIFRFLRQLIDEARICKETTCPVYANIHNLDKLRDNFTYSSVESADTGLKDRREKNDFIKAFGAYVVESKRIFSEIFALYIQTSIKKTEVLERHERLLELIKELNKNNFPIPMELTGMVQEAYNEYGMSTLDIQDPDLKAAAADYRRQMQAINAKHKKSTAKETS